MRTALLTLVFLLAALAARVVTAQTLLNIDQTMNVGENGDGKCTFRMTFTAAQFQNWQAKYGQNVSLLKRDMGKTVSQYETANWRVDVNQMEREVVITFDAVGVTVYKGNGTYEFTVPKAWRGGDRNGTSFTYSYVEALGPSLQSHNTIRLNLPATASGFKDSQSETGETVIAYKLPVKAARPAWLLMAGTGGVVLGLGFFLLELVASRGRA